MSYPIILSGIAQNIVNVTDTAFLSKVGIVELGAAGNAGIFYFILLMVGMGFTIGCQIIIGRRNGEKNYKEIGPIFNQGLFFLVPLAVLFFFFMQFLSPVILDFITASDAIVKSSNEYLSVRSYGIGFAFLNYLFISFFTGITQTKILIRSTFLMALANVIFDYLLIFGIGIFPELGVKGAALASVIAEFTALAYFFYYCASKNSFQEFHLFLNIRFDFSRMKKILKVGAPIMFQHFVALSTWLAFFTIIENVGEFELAVSHIIRSIYMVMMIPLFGFSSATSTLVSNLIGENRKSDVIPFTLKVVKLSLLSSLVFVPILFLFPEKLIGFYTNDVHLLEASIPVLNIITGAMLLFCVGFVYFAAVTGTGKTMISLAIEISCICFYVATAYLLALVYKMPLEIIWCSEFVYFGFMAGFSILFLKYGNWKSLSL